MCLVTARRAVRAGLPADQADDFVIVVSEIAANAVRYGSQAARLLLRVAGAAAQAEVVVTLPVTCCSPRRAGRCGASSP